MNQFLADVLDGLGQTPKRLHPKYFYDAAGDVLFQQIMTCEEYYLTRCEQEIFETYTGDIALALKDRYEDFDLVELGAGDASKTVHMLQELVQMKARFTYVPIDISASMIRHLQEKLPEAVPGLTVKGWNGEYFPMLRKAYAGSARKKVILFLGGNIGNMEPGAALEFCREVRTVMNEGDQILIGFDLKKNPATILAAYNDAAGYTRAFNLNLLHRINRELGGNFDPGQFEHYPTYDPLTGACKSFLVSRKDQEVRIREQVIAFQQDEVIFMEVSQKYSPGEIAHLAKMSGFVPVASFSDHRRWFVDTIWKC